MTVRLCQARSHALVLTASVALLVTAAACSDASTDRGASSRDSTTTTPATCDSSSSVAPGTERIEVPAKGGAREVERVIPPSYDGTTRLPLIVDLHGFTSTIEQQDLFSDLPAQAAARDYVLLTPQAAEASLPIQGERISGPYWNLGLDASDSDQKSSERIRDTRDDIGFLTDLIDSTVTDLCIDDARIYATGFSNGAGMTAALACAMPGRLAAIAPVSGINLAPACPALEPVSVIALHGDADPLVPYEGGSAASTNIDNTSVEDTVATFASAAGCDAEPEPSSPYPDIEQSAWTGCQPGLDIELHTVVDGGHTWPGMLNYVDVTKLAAISASQQLTELADVDIVEVAGHMTTNVEATQVMLDFFDTHRRL
ncbi:MAG TPA: PHB depolymerase family esterase [Microthrixaceae bacterium]|nr:PHB depolymerase family esterase [Microthrixaceae bacterium]